jgi:hypothetical protein
MGKTFEEIQRENREWARQHPEASKNKPQASSDAPYGLLNHVRDFTAPAAGVARRLWRLGSAIVRPVVAAVCFVAPFVEPCARGLYRVTMTRLGTDGRRHFSPKRAARILEPTKSVTLSQVFRRRFSV